jgi:cyclophilin family peptidyl-prolyl cis-trans isomerase
MARLGHDENSADSQFYIALSTLPHLDKKYTVFAKVIKGIDVLDEIKKGDKIISFKLK